MIKNELVSIIIANFNGLKYLNTCIKSVLRSDYSNFELIIIDDGSTDDSVKIINKYLKKDKRIFLYKNTRNIGAAASRNVAIKKAKGEMIVFLDNDTEVHPYWINGMMETFKKDENIGAVQSMLLDFKKRDLIQMAGGVLIPHTTWLLPYYQWNSYRKLKNDLKERDIIAISAALAVKKKVLDKVEGFDDLEAVTTEDLDFCWRIWITGYKIKLSPKSVVYHYTKKIEDREYIGNLEKIYFHLAKNSFRSMLKNYECKNFIRFLFSSLIINFGRGFAYIVIRKDFSALRGSCKALFWFIRNINKTILERKKVSMIRKYSDRTLSDYIFSKKSFISIFNEYFKKSVLENIK